MAAKDPKQEKQSVCHNKNNPIEFKIAANKLMKLSPNIIFTWKVTIPF